MTLLQLLSTAIQRNSKQRALLACLLRVCLEALLAFMQGGFSSSGAESFLDCGQLYPAGILARLAIQAAKTLLLAVRQHLRFRNLLALLSLH